MLTPHRSRPTRWLLAFALIVLGLWVGAWWLQGYVSSWIWLRNLLRSEPFHVLAHLCLYGACYSSVRAATVTHPQSIVVAVSTTLLVGCVQESIQCVTYGRAWGQGEAFDIAVDSVACAWAEAFWNTLLARSKSTVEPT